MTLFDDEQQCVLIDRLHLVFSVQSQLHRLIRIERTRGHLLSQLGFSVLLESRSFLSLDLVLDVHTRNEVRSTDHDDNRQPYHENEDQSVYAEDVVSHFFSLGVSGAPMVTIARARITATKAIATPTRISPTEPRLFIHLSRLFDRS